LKNGLKPEDYPSHFEEIKNRISDRPSEKAMSKNTDREVPTKEDKVKKNRNVTSKKKRGQRKEE
jgi:hypothetical protein